MKENNSLEQIKQRIASGPEQAVILSHPAPDGDSIGSSVGMWHLLRKRATLVAIPQPIPRRYNFLLRDIPLHSVPLDLTGKTAIVLDCSDEQRLGRIGQSLAEAALVVNIDHHRGNTHFGHLNYVDPAASAVGELIYAMFSEQNIPPSAALALFTAIYTDTGRFSFSNTSANALQVAACLVALGAEPNLVYHQVYQNRSARYYRFLARALERIELICHGRAAVVILDRQLLAEYEINDWDLEGFDEYPRGLAEVEVTAVIKEQPDKTVKLSLRSRGGRDVAAIARELGGGGHLNAAGAQLDWETGKLVAHLKKRLAGEFGNNG